MRGSISLAELLWVRDGAGSDFGGSTVLWVEEAAGEPGVDSERGGEEKAAGLEMKDGAVNGGKSEYMTRAKAMGILRWEHGTVLLRVQA